MSTIHEYLKKNGPARSARIATELSRCQSLSEVAARQRVSRARASGIHRYPRSLLPKREAFLYLDDQRNTEIFWTNLIRDMRETKSIYGYAIDAFCSRGGIIQIDEFDVISGAPKRLKGQISSERVAEGLIDLGVMKPVELPGLGDCYIANEFAVTAPEAPEYVRARLLAESVILDGLREWMRKNGFASYSKIAIRGEDHDRMVGQFKWDLTGPSYLMPLRRARSVNGFVVADVSTDYRLGAYEIRYFIRKAQLYRSSFKGGDILPILIADSFTGEAMTVGHGAGIVLATPDTLFGKTVGTAIRTLLATLKKAAAIASSNPTKLIDLIGDLAEIDGAAHNMRGILFELICAYLVKKQGDNIDLGKIARTSEGKSADIDILAVGGNATVRMIECKGREPGGVVDIEEIGQWLSKLPKFYKYIQTKDHLRERDLSYEIWTSGTFSPDALAKLEAEQKIRVTRPISWKEGADVKSLATSLKEKAIGNALNEHFLKHPLA